MEKKRKYRSLRKEFFLTVNCFIFFGLFAVYLPIIWDGLEGGYINKEAIGVTIYFFKSTCFAFLVFTIHQFSRLCSAYFAEKERIKESTQMSQQIKDYAAHLKAIEDVRRDIVKTVQELKIMMCISTDPSADWLLDQLEKKVSNKLKEAKMNSPRRGILFTTLSTYFLRAVGLEIDFRLDIKTHAPSIPISENKLAKIIAKMFDDAFEKLINYPDAQRKIKFVFDEDETLYKIAIENSYSLKDISIGKLEEEIIECNGRIEKTDFTYEIYLPKTTKEGRPILQLINGGFVG